LVQVFAADPVADEYQTNQARFTLVRAGATNQSLSLAYTLEGTASNGVDYATLPRVMVLPAGVVSTNIFTTPLPDALTKDPETLMRGRRLAVATPVDHLVLASARATCQATTWA
jgi:hypothetical protein